MLVGHGLGNRIARTVAADRPGLVRAVGITAANAPEASVTTAILADLIRQDMQLQEIHLDRGYLEHRSGSHSVLITAW